MRSKAVEKEKRPIESFMFSSFDHRSRGVVVDRFARGNNTELANRDEFLPPSVRNSVAATNRKEDDLYINVPTKQEKITLASSR